MRKLLRRLPLQFRVLYRQFLLRVVDLESLSMQADIPRLLGQFAGVLFMFSAIWGIGFMAATDHPTMTREVFLSVAWRMEQRFISTTMLIAGLIAVISWDALFPDRRDIMVLSPLPVSPRIILSAKVAASGAILGLAVLALNCVSSVALCLVMGGIPHFIPTFAAYWFTLIAASVFIYGSVLAVQGVTALLLPRWLFLRLSAVLQLGAFGLFLGTYFFQPFLTTPAAMSAMENHRLLNWLPSFWFFALFNQLKGSLPTALDWLAWRAWIGLGVVVCAASASLLLCYVRTMKKTVEEPDLAPGRGGWHWAPRFGSSLQTAIVLFSFRSLTRSKHHRVVFAFYLSLVFALALYCMKEALAAAAPRPLTSDFLMYSFWMMCLAVAGLRGVFSLPISLGANWVLRMTQLSPSASYIAAARRSMLLFAVLPVWLCVALLSICFRPSLESAAHLVVLALVGSILADIGLIGTSKIPFACSYLPGKSNVQYMFWGFLMIVVPLTVSFAKYEQNALHHPLQYLWLLGILLAVAVGLWAFNRYRAQSAVLSFEEVSPETVTTLGLSGA
ncbi:MAG TPA: hypothetical protein VGU67_09200 [Edaphobacter sp.]|nr:hypothetical protein [Edaphobacter sp.]